MIHIIVNPAGAAGRTVKYFRRSVLPLFANANYEIHYSSREKGISEIVASLTDPSAIPENGFVNLAIVGGDGTMNDVMNGVRDFEHTRIGLIPAGSGNDLAKGLDLTDKLPEIVGRIRQERTFRQADVGETILHDKGRTMRFIVSSGVGFDAECCEMADKAPMKRMLNKLRLGKLIYIFEAIKLIFLWKSTPAELTYAPRGDEKAKVEKLDKFVFSAAMNHRFEGGGFMLCPEARDDDGKLDYCIVHDLSVPEFFHFFPLALKGRHVKYKERVKQARRTSIRIKTEKPLWVHCDGEAKYTSQDVEMRIAEHKLNMMV